jgi:hypothetical protein
MQITRMKHRHIKHDNGRAASRLLSLFFMQRNMNYPPPATIFTAAKLEWLDQYAGRMKDATRIMETYQNITVEWNRSFPADFVVIDSNE